MMMYRHSLVTLVLVFFWGCCCSTTTFAFTPLSSRTVATLKKNTNHVSAVTPRRAEDEKASSSGVVELGDDSDSDDKDKAPAKDLPQAVSGPLFISQGEVDPDTLNPDFSDAKQTRVILYTILSLLPVLFLIPFMLGRDFIPADALPPVEIN